MITSGSTRNYWQYYWKLLPPSNEVCEGYVFTRDCLSTEGGSAIGGGCLLPGGAWSREVPGQGDGGVPGPGGVWRPPVTATAAGGTHPT